MSLLHKRTVNKRVIVRVLPKPEKSEGGILIPGSANAVFEDGEVIISSSDIVQIGEIAIYPGHLGVEFHHEGIKHKWLNDSEIWGINDEKPLALSLA